MNRTQVSILLPLLLAPASFAQPPQAASTPVISTTSQEVLLDVVVRDKKGKSLRDLEGPNFHITDNGEPVKVNHFRLVDRSAQTSDAAAAATPGSAPAKLDPLRQIRLVTLIRFIVDSFRNFLPRESSFVAHCCAHFERSNQPVASQWRAS